MCCMQLTGNTECKNYAKNRHLHTIARLCRAISAQLRHVATNGKKIVKQQYLLQVSPHYRKLLYTNGWDRLASLGNPNKFQMVLCLSLGFVTAVMSLTGGQPHLARCLAISWAGTLYIYIFGSCCPWRNFATCKIHFESKSRVLLYWQHYCTAVSQNLWRATRNGITELSQTPPPIFGWAAITLGINPYSSFI